MAHPSKPAKFYKGSTPISAVTYNRVLTDRTGFEPVLRPTTVGCLTAWLPIRDWSGERDSNSRFPRSKRDQKNHFCTSRNLLPLLYIKSQEPYIVCVAAGLWCLGGGRLLKTIPTSILYFI